jgi:hypothetical protein
MASPTSRTAPETDTTRRDKRRGAGQPTDLDELDDEGLEDSSATDDTDGDEADDLDDAWSPDDDDAADLGLGAEDPEEIGLDTATGFEGAEDDEDLDAEGEGVSWTADSEDADDLPDTDTELGQGEEYGWLGDDEGPADDELFDPELGGDETPLSSDDGGAEGLDDDADFDALDVSTLPAIDADADDPEGSASTEAFDDLASEILSEEPTLELANGASYKRVADKALRIARSALPDGAWGVTSIALCDDGRQLAIALGTQGALFVGSSADARFERAPGLCGRAGVAWLRGEGGPTLFCLELGGGLVTARERGKRVCPVATPGAVECLLSDGTRVFVRTQAEGDAPRFWQAASGGKRLVPSTLPELPVAAELLAASRATLLFARDEARVMCALREAEPRELSALARPPACLVDEDDEVFAYVCLHEPEAAAAQRRLVLARVPVRNTAGAASQPLVIAALPGADIGQPRALAASCAEGLVTLYLVTDTELVRIDASLDGEALA